MNKPDLEVAILKVVKSRGAFQLRQLVHPNVIENIRRLLKEQTGMEWTCEWFDVNAAVWALIARKLAWIDTYEVQSSQWRLNLTERGSAVAEQHVVNPDDPTGYMRHLVADSPRTTATVQFYLQESLRSFEQECYLASAVSSALPQKRVCLMQPQRLQNGKVNGH